MNRTEFYEIIKNENLDRYPIGDSKHISNIPYVVGCVPIDDKWCVYENDEKGDTNIIIRYFLEEEGLVHLLGILRKKKRKESLINKLNGYKEDCF